MAYVDCWFCVPLDTKIGNFGYVLSSQSLDVLLKKTKREVKPTVIIVYNCRTQHSTEQF